jgi:uncharacterized membrane protein YcaP (DUF421 family)
VPAATSDDADSWLLTTWPTVGWILLSGLLMVVAVVAIIRLIGLRSLSKMSSFDFAVTVAIGSILGSTSRRTRRSARARWRSCRCSWCSGSSPSSGAGRSGAKVVDNRPILLVRDGRFIDDALDEARVTRSDVYAKMRQANVHSMSEVLAVVLETTGDISVLYGTEPLQPELFDNVRQFDPQGPLTPERS